MVNKDGVVWECAFDGTWYFWANRSASLVFQGAVAEEDTILALHGSELSVIGSDEQVRYQIAMSTADEEAAPPRIEFVPGSGDSVTIDPSTLESFPVETCVDPGTGEECVLLTVRGIGPPQVGTINVTTGEATVPIPMTVDVDATLGYDGLPANCQIGPINGVFTSNDLDPTSGEATLEVQDLPLPEVTTCGDYNDFFNGVLSLPGSHVDGTINALIGL